MIKDEFLLVLCEKYPFTFNLKRPKPLEIGIFHKVRAGNPTVPSRTVSKTLHLYTGTLAYQKALTKQASRVDLAGTPSGVVAPEAKKKAIEEVKRIKSAIAHARRVKARKLASKQNTTESANV